MAKQVWDFECPQFVDFEKELDSSGKDDVFFDAKDQSSRNGSLFTPEVQGTEKGLTESDENRLLDKMTAALSFLENTPKLKKSVSKSKLFSKSVFKGAVSKVTKSPEKANTVPAPRPRPRRSKSLDNLNKIISGKANKRKKYALRKSSSLNDLKTHKMKYPVTPMCLKRTIFKAKEKVLKTTEEMELEKIATLQKQLIQHLRQNEISLKKLNLRPRQYTALKILPNRDNLKAIKGAGTLAEKTDVDEKEPRRNIRKLSQTTLKKEASKLDTIINHENVSNKKTVSTVCPRKSKFDSVSSVGNRHMLNESAVRKEDSKLNITVEAASSSSTIYSRKEKTLSVSTAISDAISNSTQKSKRLPYKKILAHSGLIFIPSLKRNTSMKSFIFEERNKEKPQTASAKQKETSALNFKEKSDDKENKGCSRRELSSKKCQKIKIAKCDINKLDEPSKNAGERSTNPLKGVPLAENVARN